MKYDSPRGTRDLFLDDIQLFQFIESQAQAIFSRFGFLEMRTPCFEHTDVFTRGIGDHTDIVNKEMYTFEDKSGRSLTLRPEGTASVIRAVIQHHLLRSNPTQKLYYTGPFFRYERPQSGRFRQFYQMGAEYVGSDSFYADIEMIHMAYQLLCSLGLRDLEVHVNSIGDQASRQAITTQIQSHLHSSSSLLCSACQTRLAHQPLRVLDCKSPTCQTQLNTLPDLRACLSKSSIARFESVQNGLHALHIPFTLNPKLVRGLDYYNDVVFEIISTDLGTQNAVCGGGRYDTLIETLGGQPSPAVGFAMGLDRLVMMMQKAAKIPQKTGLTLMLAPLSNAYQASCFQLMCDLREQGFSAQLPYQHTQLKHHLKQAGKLGVDFLIILGEDEAKKGEYLIKDLNKRSQYPLSETEVIDHFKNI